MKVSGAGDHGGIISTELDRWITKAYSEREKFLLKPCTKTEISSDSTSQDDLFHMIFLCSKARLDRQHIDNSFLKTGG
jgi:hypothetical protein